MDEYAKLIKGLGYIHSIYLFGYEINLVAIKRITFISFFSIGHKSRLISVIHYNPKIKKHEAYYVEKWINDHPLISSLLNKVTKELINRGLEVDERGSKGYVLPFKTPIKNILSSTKWDFLIDNKPNLTPTERAELIGVELNLDPVAVACYGRLSLNKRVKSEAHKAVNFIFESKYELTTKWRYLIDNFPDLKC